MKNLTNNILFSNEVSKNNDLLAEPHNIDAEQAILGSLLTNNEAYSKIGDFLKGEHFFEPIHQKIFTTIVDFYNQGLIATPITLKNSFDKEEALENLGGSNYLGDLAKNATNIINIKDYAKVIFDLYLKRKLIELGNEMVIEINDHKDLSHNSQNLIEKTEQQLFNLASEGNLEGGFQKLNISLNQSLETIQNSIDSSGFCGLPTNLIDLDKLLGGIQDSDLIILVGRPSMGKTALAINMAVNASIYFKEQKQNSSAGFFP